jgi:hypothetical protein
MDLLWRCLWLLASLAFSPRAPITAQSEGRTAAGEALLRKARKGRHVGNSLALIGNSLALLLLQFIDMSMFGL